ncbi:hypothetical protein DKX38_012711 [Salix brachista]|uniref:ABC-2 type transporter transmembrane domain-containing protein n=1 Tax=Salix brachista TaxID=2182728 RepID=A0A5N5LPE0_9ROSI|nr:hypothetical protein DKX38_012711 [Salix brachista]
MAMASNHGYENREHAEQGTGNGCENREHDTEQGTGNGCENDTEHETSTGNREEERQLEFEQSELRNVEAGNDELQPEIGHVEMRNEEPGNCSQSPQSLVSRDPPPAENVMEPILTEPTSGLDARAAAVVMRAVKNVAETGRTVVCTIHQPSIDIFEAFEELLLMKLGGRIIYFGPVGQFSSKVIEYFEVSFSPYSLSYIPGVPKIEDKCNPATWMLEVTSRSAEAELGVDFAQIYRQSTLYKENKQLVEQLSSPIPGSKDLHFPRRFPQNGWEQLKACIWKLNLAYWRSPKYNLTRIFYSFSGSVLFGLLFWQQGKQIENHQDLFNILGSMYSAIIFFGISNCSGVLPYIAAERTVLYRERFAGMYSSWAYSLAQVLVEVPYLLAQAIIYATITHTMIGHSLSPHKIFWSVYGMFCTLLSLNYLGMLLVSVTPDIQLASALSSPFYTMLHLFSGFFVPRTYGDVEKEIAVFGQTKSVAAFLEDYFGFHRNFLSVVAVVLIIFPAIFASLFAYFIGRLNFQKRNNQQDLFSMLGAMYMVIIFFGVNSCSTVLPYVSAERTVLYRERFAGTYSAWTYSLAQMLEDSSLRSDLSLFPVLLKICWFFSVLDILVLLWDVLHIALLQLPGDAAHISDTKCSSGYHFMLNRIHNDELFIWIHCTEKESRNAYLNRSYMSGSRIATASPTSYSNVVDLVVLYLSHVLGTRGYVHLAIWRSGQGNISIWRNQNCFSFIEDYFGYRQNFLGVAGLALITIPIVVASLFTYFIGKLNFQRR